MAPGYRSGLLALGVLSLTFVLSTQQHIQPPNPSFYTLRNQYALHADRGATKDFVETCLYPRFTTADTQIRQTPSIESLIDLIQKLEDRLANITDPILQNFKTPDMIARLILQRFNIEFFQSFDWNVDPYINIDTYILRTTPNVGDWYYFPDDAFTETEKCTLFKMFSHAYINTAVSPTRNSRTNSNYLPTQTRGKRQANQQRTFVFNRNPTNSPYVDNDGSNIIGSNMQNETQEMGVVSFKGDLQEAIAPARVLYGVVAAFAQSPRLSGKEIVALPGIGSMVDDNEADLKDPVLAVTVGSLVGRGIFPQQTNNQGSTPSNINMNFAFGISGQWSNSTCGMTYTLDNSVNNFWTFRRSVRYSLAEMRGAIDGYIIGKSIQSSSGADAQKLKLSTILRSYYSIARKNTGSLNTVKVNYCDRTNLKPSDQDVNDVSESYSRIYKFFASKEGSDILRRDGYQATVARATQGQNQVCSAPTIGNFKCETPSDLIFVIDGRQEYELKSAIFIQQLVSRIPNIGRYGGAVSVFYSGSSNVGNVQLPGSWPFGALAFNTSNVGALTCALTPESSLSSQTNFYKHLQNLNTTLTQYKWWSWRRTLGGVPARNAILLSFGKMTASTSGQEATDIDTYRRALKYRARDVLYLVATPDKALYQPIVRDDKFIVTEGSVDLNGVLATEWAKQICQNPATLQYNECRDKASNNYTHDLWVTPGAEQYWAVYPEYFRLSENLDITVSGVDGDISVCWDYYFSNVDKYCHEVSAGSGYGWSIERPCKGESIHTCKPIYITIRGKELKNKPFCSDPECQNLEQIKVQISHTGMRCGAVGLTVSIALTFILAMIPGIFNRFF